jgi:hypothetical protein
MGTNLRPEHVLVGLAAANRETLSSLLALYEDSTLPTLLLAQAKDVAKWARERWSTGTWMGAWPDDRAFADSLARTSLAISDSDATDDELRVRLWLQLRCGLGIGPELPLTRRDTADATADVCDSVAVVHRDLLVEAELRKTSMLEAGFWQTKWNTWTGKLDAPPNFSDAVHQQVVRLIAAAAERGELDREIQQELVCRVRSLVDGLSDAERASLLESLGVDKLSDDAAIQLLLGGGGLVGFGVAVEVAGFAAYILAAKLSAIIPLVGGKTMVSLVAVVAAPQFIIPAVLGGGLILAGHLKRQLHRAYCAPVGALLALTGLDARYGEIDHVLGVFSELPDHVPPPLLKGYMKAKDRKENPDRRPEAEWSWESAWKLALWAGRWIARWLAWLANKSKDQIVASEYPEIQGYLRSWEEATGREISF